MEKYLTYRVAAVTNTSTAYINKPVAFTSHSYCLPESKIWLTEIGLEIPNSNVILLELIEVAHWLPKLQNGRWRVEFEYDEGRYIGTFHDMTSRLYGSAAANRPAVIARRLDIPNNLSAVIRDISSL